jgi:hypothetical protein
LKEKPLVYCHGEHPLPVVDAPLGLLILFMERHPHSIYPVTGGGLALNTQSLEPIA